MSDMGPVARGVQGGLGVGVCVIGLAVVGLNPAFSWVPEAPLIALAIAVPLVGYLLTGLRATRDARFIQAGLTAGAVAGLVSGAIGGLAYVLAGKPALNVLVGAVIGLLGGGVVGAVGGRIGLRKR